MIYACSLRLASEREPDRHNEKILVYYIKVIIIQDYFYNYVQDWDNFPDLIFSIFQEYLISSCKFSVTLKCSHNGKGRSTLASRGNSIFFHALQHKAENGALMA